MKIKKNLKEITIDQIKNQLISIIYIFCITINHFQIKKIINL